MVALMFERSRMLGLDMLVNSGDVFLWLGKVAVGALDISVGRVNVLITRLRLHGTSSRVGTRVHFFPAARRPLKNEILRTHTTQSHHAVDLWHS